MRSLLRLSLAAGLLIAPALAVHADTIVVQQIGPILLPGGGSLTYGAATTSFNAPTSLVQTGTLTTAANSGDDTFNLTLQDVITIQNVTKTVSILGDGQAGANVETITTFATGPIAFGTLLLNIPQSTFFGLGSVPVSLTGNITTAPVVPPSPVPEPSSIALLGTGVLGLAGVARRKFVKA